MKLKLRLCVIWVTVCFLISAVVYAAPGDVDSGFNAGAFIHPTDSSSIRAITIQMDGRILVGGVFYVNNYFSILVQLNADGSLDNSFNIGVSNQSVLVLAVQADGRQPDNFYDKLGQFA